MQAKGIVRFFLVLLLLGCAWQLIYIFPTNKVENDADARAKKEAALTSADKKEDVYKMVRAHYLDSMSSTTVLDLPLMGKFTYQQCKSNQLALGLDLKGGMSVVLQVNLQDFIKSLSGNSTDKDFKNALDAAVASQKQTQGDFIQIFVNEFKKSGRPLAAIFSRNESLKNEIKINSSDAVVQNILRTKANETVNETFKRLQQRIDKLGVVQPNVSLDKSRDMIMVELPGIDNPARARTFLQAAAKLQFWEVYRTTDVAVMNGLKDADNALKASEMTPDTSAKSKPDSLKMAGRGPLLSMLTPTVDQQGQRNAGSAVIGTADKNKRDAISTLLKREDIAAKFPRELVFAWSKDGIAGKDGKNTNIYSLYALRKTAGKDDAALDGDVVTDAKANLDPQTSNMEVSLSMNNAGAAAWGQLTTRAAADNKREVAIVLDSAVVSAPSVNTPILEGRSSITGNYTVQEANDFASILQVGKLPARTEIVQESTIGPTLGAENISKSLISLLVALLTIVAFMCVYYASGGIVAVVALLANLIFIVGALTSIHTVLTLPGIAGIVLTMGIAVDANVIVYERIREELHNGRTLATAIKDGFLHSYPAIIDGNVTNIITALVLMYFGLGPVKGFAVVLLVGVLFTLFTSLLLSRLVIDWWVGRGNDIKFSNTWSENAFKNINIDWMAMRGKTYILSGAFILAGIIAFFVRGFDLGVDFKGGYSYNVQFEKSVTNDQLRTALTKSFDNQSTIVKAVSTANTFNITTSYLVKETSSEAQEKVTTKLYEGLKGLGVIAGDTASFKKSSGNGTHITSASKVGPMVADDITRSSVIANVIALFLIFMYILIRFSRWQYSTGAVIALFHDVLFILSCFTLFHGFLPFSLEVDQAIVAAVLTISAYSMNDTVIVYDRIREYTRTYSEKPMREVINSAINSTLSRTIITSLNVLLVVLILFIFGGSSIKGFAFALIVGIFIGTYSSIFIASPVMLDLSKNLNLASNKKPTVAPKTDPEKGASKAKKALKV